MTEVVVAQRMWQRRDTAANWTSKNPVLAAGEIGVELGSTALDPQKFKIGNGVSAWTALAYGGGGGTGTTWRDGAGAPSNSLGIDGDYYLDDATGNVYKKATGTYSVVANIKGPTGATGATGPAGPTGDPGPPGPSSSAFFGATFNGGGGDIDVGARCSIPVPFGFDITKVTLVSDTTGTFVVDVWVTTYAAFPPSVADSVCGVNKPSLAGTQKYQDTVLISWTTAVVSNSVITFRVDSCTGIENATILIEGVRT